MNVVTSFALGLDRGSSFLPRILALRNCLQVPRPLFILSTNSAAKLTMSRCLFCL